MIAAMPFEAGFGQQITVEQLLLIASDTHGASFSIDQQTCGV